MADVDLMEQVLANPDLAAVAALLGEKAPDEPENEEVVEAGEPTSAEVKEEEQSEEVVEANGQEEPQGIATKSGKGVIPYAVLATERERRQAAETAALQLQQRIADLERQASTGVKQDAEAIEATDDELSQISEDFPQLGKLIKGLQSKLAATEERLQQVRSVTEQRAAEEAADSRRSVQEAMDENRPLLYWRDKEPELFEQAIEIDQQLQANPRFSHLSLTERFAKVVDAMEALYGPTDLPSEYQIQAPTKSEQKVSEKELAQKAKEAAAKAEKSARPRTLSDMPGGVSMQTDDNLANMSASELASMMASKSPDEIAAFVARYG